METCVKSEKTLKKEYKDQKERVFFRVNLKVPCLSGNPLFQKNTQKLYDGVYDGFLAYCEKKARKYAAAAAAADKSADKKAAAAKKAADKKAAEKSAAKKAAEKSAAKKTGGKDNAAGRDAAGRDAAGSRNAGTKSFSGPRDDPKPLGGVLKYTVTLENERFISIITDASLYDGKSKSRVARLSQVWSKAEGRLLHFYDFFSRADREKILSLIYSAAKSKAELGMAEYKPHLKNRIESFVDFSDFYLVPGGYAFYFAAGDLSDSRLPEVFITTYRGEKLLQ